MSKIFLQLSRPTSENYSSTIQLILKRDGLPHNIINKYSASWKNRRRCIWWWFGGRRRQRRERDSNKEGETSLWKGKTNNWGNTISNSTSIICRNVKHSSGSSLSIAPLTMSHPHHSVSTNQLPPSRPVQSKHARREVTYSYPMTRHKAISIERGEYVTTYF